MDRSPTKSGSGRRQPLASLSDSSVNNAGDRHQKHRSSDSEDEKTSNTSNSSHSSGKYYDATRNVWTAAGPSPGLDILCLAASSASRGQTELTHTEHKLSQGHPPMPTTPSAGTTKRTIHDQTGRTGSDSTIPLTLGRFDQFFPARTSVCPPKAHSKAVKKSIERPPMSTSPTLSDRSESIGLEDAPSLVRSDDESCSEARSPKPKSSERIPHDPMRCFGHEPCIYTESPMRKTCSHFFGRNKRCTRAIPDNCWILMCRKHYQRGRYGKAEKWYQVQGVLVEAQIESMERNIGPVSWKIQFGAQLNKAMGDYLWCQQTGDDYSENDDQGKPRPKATTCAFVSREVKPLLGEGKSSDQVMNVWKKIDAALAGGTIEDFPMVEFLVQESQVHDTNTVPKLRPSKSRQPPPRALSRRPRTTRPQQESRSRVSPVHQRSKRHVRSPSS